MSKEKPIFGIDVHSEYQRGLNFERARAEGYEFCVIKATEGPYRDGERYVPTGFKEFYRRAEVEGFVMGAYHFLLSTPAKAQADHFLRTIDAVGGPEDKILMVDFEHHPNPALTPGNDQLEGFIAEVKRRIGDHPLVVYSARNFWNGGDSSGDFDQYGADVAWDAYYLHMDPVRPRQFYANSEQYFEDAGISWGWGKPWGGVEPWFWQFTSAGGVAGMNIDVNAYRGTRSQLLALTGLEEPAAIADDEGKEDVGDGRTGNGGRRVLSHGVVDGTNFALDYKYIMQLNNRMKYWVWTSGNVPDGEGAYAANKPLPPAEELKGRRIFCAGVPNIFRRAAGKVIPNRNNLNFDGGIAAYFYTPAFGGLGPGFFSGVDVPFNLATAKKWARETGSGVLVGRCYRSNSLAGQGHVAILLPDGKVLQSFQFGADGEPGLNTDFTIEQSHAGGYYEVMVHPNAWINHDKGQIRKAPPRARRPRGRTSVNSWRRGATAAGTSHRSGPKLQKGPTRTSRRSISRSSAGSFSSSSVDTTNRPKLPGGDQTPVTTRWRSTRTRGDGQGRHEWAAVKQPRTSETGAYRPGSMDGKELPVGNVQGQQSAGEGAQQKPAYGFFLVLAAIVVVAIMYSVTIWLIGAGNRTPETVFGAMAASFTVIGTLVGTYFGIKAGLDGQDKVKDSVAMANGESGGRPPTRARGNEDRTDGKPQSEGISETLMVERSDPEEQQKWEKVGV